MLTNQSQFIWYKANVLNHKFWIYDFMRLHLDQRLLCFWHVPGYQVDNIFGIVFDWFGYKWEISLLFKGCPKK